MDELSAHAKADPVAYRLRHLREARLIDVVKAAAQVAKWDARPSPKSEQRRGEIASGRGIACVAYEGDNGYVALIAEVEVDPASGRIRAKRFVAAHPFSTSSHHPRLRHPNL